MITAKKAMPPWHVYACNGVIEIQSKDFGTVVKWQGFDGTDYSHQANLKNAFLMAAAPEHHAVALELDRLMLVIESAVRWQDPTHHTAVVALVKANRAVIAKAIGSAHEAQGEQP